MRRGAGFGGAGFGSAGATGRGAGAGAGSFGFGFGLASFRRPTSASASSREVSASIFGLAETPVTSGISSPRRAPRHRKLAEWSTTRARR